MKLKIDNLYKMFKIHFTSYKQIYNGADNEIFLLISDNNIKYILRHSLRKKIKQDIYFEVQDLYITMIQLEKQIPLLAVKVRQTLENFELADGRYAVGLGDYIELQDAKVNYNNAQVSYVQTVYNYNVARANLEKAIALPQSITTTIEDDKW